MHGLRISFALSVAVPFNIDSMCLLGVVFIFFFFAQA